MARLFKTNSRASLNNHISKFRSIGLHLLSILASNQPTFANFTTSLHHQDGLTSCKNFGFGFLAPVLNIFLFLVHVHFATVFTFSVCSY